jgi:hypothetical protein
MVLTHRRSERVLRIRTPGGPSDGYIQELGFYEIGKENCLLRSLLGGSSKSKRILDIQKDPRNPKGSSKSSESSSLPVLYSLHYHRLLLCWLSIRDGCLGLKMTPPLDPPLHAWRWDIHQVSYISQQAPSRCVISLDTLNVSEDEIDWLFHLRDHAWLKRISKWNLGSLLRPFECRLVINK